MINILAEAIKIQTTEDKNEQNMPKIHNLIEKSFPLVHKNMSKTIVGNSLLYKIKGKGNPVMFCGHLDVVSAEGQEWKHLPYEAHNDGEYLWGRGTLDCKNVVFGVLSAMEKLFEQGFIPKHTIYLAFGHDEEIGGENGAYQIVQKLKAEGVKLDLVLDEGGGIVTDLLPNKNFASIALAEKNILRLKLTAPSNGGHAAFKIEKTALYRLAKAIIALEENPMNKEVIPLIQKHIDIFQSSYPQLVENYVDNPQKIPFIQTTIAPTMIEASKAPNILPNAPYLVCDIRIIPTQTVQDVINHIENLITDLDITIEILQKPLRDGKCTDYNAIFYKNIEELIKEKFNDCIVVPNLMVGGTDARHYEEICDVVLRFAPFQCNQAQGKTIHTANERIAIKSFNEAIDFYIEFIKRYI